MRKALNSYNFRIQKILASLGEQPLQEKEILLLVLLWMKDTQYIKHKQVLNLCSREGKALRLHEALYE